MGVNELYVSANEESHAETASSFKQRDQNAGWAPADKSSLDWKQHQIQLSLKEREGIQIENAAVEAENVPALQKATEPCTTCTEDIIWESSDAWPSRANQDQQEAHGSEVQTNLNWESSTAIVNNSDIEEILTANNKEVDSLGPNELVSLDNSESEIAIQQIDGNDDSAPSLKEENKTEICQSISSKSGKEDDPEDDQNEDQEEDYCDEDDDSHKGMIEQLDLDDDAAETDNFIAQKELETNSKTELAESNSIFDALNYWQEESVEDQPEEPLEISTNILSYERFFPGRILGNTFVLKNIGNKTVRFELSFDNRNIDRHYVGDKLCDYYGWSISEIEDSYAKHLKKDIKSTEETLNVWYVEDPYTKRLAKNVEMELDPDEEYEFIVVLKSPVVNKQNIFAANVVINNTTTESLQTIFCFGWMENLKLHCPKELYNQKLKSKMVKIVMRRKQAAMPIKVLLENKGDMPICGTFQSVEMEKNMQFYIPRDKLTIEPNSKALLEIKAMHKLGHQASKKEGDSLKPEVIHKLVVAKIKDCEFKFSLIFEITVI